MMTPEDVKARVAEIAAACKADDEAAHGMEDELHYDVLAAIASRDIEDATECARLALTTSAIEFARWCA